MPSTFDSPRATFQAIGDASGNASRRSTSSMSTFQLPSAGSKETSTNLDFNTNFDLSFAQQSGPTPYALREHERRFALFLEPSSNSRFYNSIEKFNDKVFRTLGPNQAQNYTPHISIIDSLVLTRGEEWENRWEAVKDLQDTVEDTIRDLAPQMQSPIFEGLGIVDKPEKALVIGLRSSDSYNELVRRLNRTMYDKHRVKANMRPMNRLHLAYDKHHPLNEKKLARLQELANETIAAEDLVWHRVPFDIVLYEVMLESQVTGVRHQMAELGRWRVVDGISKHPAATPTNFFMPASIVGTLKVMMTRWKLQSGKKRLRKEWKAIDTRLQSKLLTTA